MSNQNFDNNGKAGLWQKQSQKGNTYFGGKMELDGKEYFVSLFDNMSKKRQNPKAPDFQIIVSPVQDNSNSNNNPDNTPF